MAVLRLLLSSNRMSPIKSRRLHARLWRKLGGSWPVRVLGWRWREL